MGGGSRIVSIVLTTWSVFLWENRSTPIRRWISRFWNYFCLLLHFTSVWNSQVIKQALIKTTSLVVICLKEDHFCVAHSWFPHKECLSGRPGIDEEDKLQILSGGSQPLASSNEIKAELPCEHSNQSTLTLNVDAWPRSHLVIETIAPLFATWLIAQKFLLAKSLDTNIRDHKKCIKTQTGSQELISCVCFQEEPSDLSAAPLHRSLQGARAELPLA